jgi:hypothetical protein
LRASTTPRSDKLIPRRCMKDEEMTAKPCTGLQSSKGGTCSGHYCQAA